jgi:hypothetical protein
MKTPFSIFNFQLPIARQCRKSSAARRFQIGNRQLAIGNARSGMALVITLILLSVTLVMAIALIAMARRERNAVTTASDTTIARLAADAALAAAQGQIVANLLATTNAYNYGLLVSTNFVTPGGITPGSATTTYINYFDTTGNLLTGPDLEQAIANLYFLPRAPVFVYNRNTGLNEFRFYLDLNRNGLYDANGQVAVTDSTGATNGTYINATGDPEWIGVLEHPDQLHGPNNPFVGRYAFFAQPIGNSLDLNYIHNQTLTASLVPPDGFFRNQGVGSWELNLAAFLADLNTNYWGQTIGAPSTFYQYNQPGANNSGLAFGDAQSLLSYRYANTYNSLNFAPLNVQALVNAQLVDGYTVGNLMTNTYLSSPLFPANKLWAGSDSTNRFFALPTDLFDPTKSSAFFVNRLAAAGAGKATYDRYTFYRLLSQLGTDSVSDDNRMNLNFRNMISGTVVPGMETNYIAWTPLDFFTNAADRMLRYYTANWFAANPTNYLVTYFNYLPTTTILPNGQGMPSLAPYFTANQVPAFGLNSIPVYVNGQLVYQPAVNRILQLAANMYDASTNTFYPSVFRPTFTVVQNGGYNNLYINGYTYVDTVAGAGDNRYFLQPADASVVASANNGSVLPAVNIYGVPWIIGAKKGLPGFSQFYMLDSVQAVRRLQVSKTSLNGPITTNQQYSFSISNTLGCSLWNPYTNSYFNVNNLTIVANDRVTMLLTNSAPGAVTPVGNTYLIAYTNITINAGATWPGTIWNGSPSTATLDQNNNSFIIPFYVPFQFMTNAIYRYSGYAGTYALPNGAPGFDPYNTDFQLNVKTPPLPQLGLLMTNRLQVFILDGNHVIDYVHFAGPQSSRYLNLELADPDYTGFNANYLWSTNGINNGATPWGVGNQINISRGLPGATVPPNGVQWNPQIVAGVPKGAETLFFDAFFKQGNKYDYGGKAYYNTNLSVQAPYTALKTSYEYVTWQVNDPLVHYLVSDLNYVDPGTTGVQQEPTPPTSNLATLIPPKRYSPWGQTYPFQPDAGGSYLTKLKDSLVWSPDNWDFPTFKYPTVGWLGRVHRGTPWQTVYLKSADILVGNVINAVSGVSAWTQWTGNQQSFDANNSAPMQDGGLFDLFSASLNDNATHGTLSVNQSDIAAWSAVFSGLVALSNSAPDSAGYIAVTNTIIQPAGPDTNAPFWQLVYGGNGINATRGNFSQKTFTHIGDVLRTPALSDQSPFLNTDAYQQQNAISDEVYEWLPQQVLGLLRADSTPRYVIYCYGQRLVPAPNGKVLSGPNFGMITNYQVTAESAARVVIRVENASTKSPHAVIESFNVQPPD